MGESFEKDTAAGKCSHVRTSWKGSSAEERPSSSLRIQVIQERLGQAQCQDIEMHHLDEVVAEENFYALEVNFQEDKEEIEMNCGATNDRVQGK